MIRTLSIAMSVCAWTIRFMTCRGEGVGEGAGGFGVPPRWYEVNVPGTGIGLWIERHNNNNRKNAYYIVIIMI